jgi:hypothetical protein
LGVVCCYFDCFAHRSFHFASTMRLLFLVVYTYGVWGARVSSLALAFSAAEVKCNNNPLPSQEAKNKQKQKRIKPIPYIATTSTTEHGRALTQFLQPGDRVLELGTNLDASTQIICNAVGSDGHAVLCELFPTGRSGRINQGSRDSELFAKDDDNDDGITHYNNFEYIELDQFSQYRRVLDDNVETPFDVMVLDATAVLGNDLELTSLSVIMEFVDDMERRGKRRPRCVIVKSKAISSLSRRLVHAQRLFDGSTVRDFTTPSRDGRPYIIASVGVDEYRRTIPHVVRKGDACLEVGCFSGSSTRLVHDAATKSEKIDGDTSTEGTDSSGYCIGVDIGPKIIERAKREHPDIHFAVGDAWKTLELLRIQRDAEISEGGGLLDGYDVIYADIGGLSGADGTLESLSLLDGLGYALEPRCIVIKSLCMRRLASSLRNYSALADRK